MCRSCRRPHAPAAGGMSGRRLLLYPRGHCKTLTLSQANESDTLEQFTVEEFTIVGLCSSPLFLNFERGSTTLGKGSLTAYMYVPEGAFDLDGVYTEDDLKLDQNYPMYDAAMTPACQTPHRPWSRWPRSWPRNGIKL